MPDYPPYNEIEVYCKATECGIGDSLYTSVLIGDMQEAAEQSSYSLGYGTDFLKENNMCWIILRMHIEIERLPKWHETFKIRTWATGLEKLYYGREFEVYDSQGTRIGKAIFSFLSARSGVSPLRDASETSTACANCLPAISVEVKYCCLNEIHFRAVV